MPSLYFYDLETSGFNPKEARIVQFAGQRVNQKLEPIGQPHNVLITQTDDSLPDPGAVFVTKITPQQTWADGMREAEFLELFHKEIAVPDTVFIGYNTIRFDDEFMRYLHFRNFYDPYEWQWQEGRSRWDLLDAVRMTRALRPDGIVWPFDSQGRPSNRLELLTASNNLSHTSAHDALSDVMATIELARLLQRKQPKLFDYLMRLRNKEEVKKIVESGRPFVYTSGRYPSEFEKTTLAVYLAAHPHRSAAALVYDLRCDPKSLARLTPAQIAEAWYPKTFDEKQPPFPVKTLAYNRCPAIAPLGTLDVSAQKRLHIDIDATCHLHLDRLRAMTEWPERLFEALEIMQTHRQTQIFADNQEAESLLYDGFYPEADRKLLSHFRQSQPESLAKYIDKFQDPRLKALVLPYKARNFPKSLTTEEKQQWEEYRQRKLFDGGNKSRLAKFLAQLEELSKVPALTAEQGYLLEEMQLFAQSLVPASH